MDRIEKLAQFYMAVQGQKQYEKQLEEEMLEYQKYIDDKTTKTVAMRLGEYHIFLLDYLASQYEISRAQFLQDLVKVASVDFLESIGDREEEVFADFIESKKQEKGDN